MALGLVCVSPHCLTRLHKESSPCLRCYWKFDGINADCRLTYILSLGRSQEGKLCVTRRMTSPCFEKHVFVISLADLSLRITMRSRKSQVVSEKKNNAMMSTRAMSSNYAIAIKWSVKPREPSRGPDPARSRMNVKAGFE